MLTAVGILGVIISLATMQSDYDTIAFGIATISILIAIVGISLALKAPSDNKTGKPERALDKF